MKTGIQLYSLRKYLKNDDGYRRILAECKGMGAKTVQLSGGADIDSKVFAAIAAENDLEICCSHSPFARIRDDLDRLANEHLDFDCRQIGIGMMPREFNSGKLEDLERFIEFLNETAEKLDKYGMTVAYHNHWFEFKEIDGKRIFDRMIEQTDKRVNFIPDTFWITVGGGESVDYISRLSGRIGTLHLKDYSRILGAPVFRAIGKGKLDIAKIMEQAEKSGVEYAVAELDVSPNPLKSARFSMETLKKLGY